MKKAFIAVIIASLFLTPAAFGIEEKFSDWVYAGDSLVIDEQSFSFKLSTSSMSVAHNDDLYIIGLGKCNGGELVKICLNDTNWDSLTDETSARISISFYKPVISITRTTKTPTVDVGEKINFDIDVLNTGDLDAKNVKYTDSFPKEIFIEKVSGACEKGENNSIISTGTLKRGNKISCTYIVIPKDVVDIKLKAQVDYFDGFKDEKTYSGLIDIKANAIFDINAFHKKSLYEDNVSGA
ncbi:DUF11 domain-containing protein, partial [Candidatus Woesearchaeota archaeon]|nr:DUF11 domain-containing protein [Candidatus Woesearchaeota archaeon]